MTMFVLWVALAFGGDVPDLYQQSYEQEALGAWRSAIGSLEQMPRSEQGSYTWKLRKAWLLYLDGQYGPSATAYDAAIAAAPEALEPKLGKMLPLMAARRWVDAEKLGREVLAVDARSYLGRSRTAWAVFNLGRYAEATELYRSVLADFPSDVEMRAGLGWSLLRNGDRAGAAEQFTAVLRVAPKHASASAGLAEAR